MRPDATNASKSSLDQSAAESTVVPRGDCDGAQNCFKKSQVA
jgi:hypothetical protein